LQNADEERFGADIGDLDLGELVVPGLHEIHQPDGGQDRVRRAAGVSNSWLDSPGLVTMKSKAAWPSPTTGNVSDASSVMMTASP